MSMPRRPLWLLTTIALAVIAATFWLLPKSGTGDWKASLSRHSSSNSRPPLADDVVADREILTELKLSSPFEFRRICINAHPRRGGERSSLDEHSEKLFDGESSQGLTNDDLLPPCQTSVKMDVPYFNPSEKVDTSELFLGMATLLTRIDASLPALSRWLSKTGSPLLVLLVDQPDLETKAQEIEAVRQKAANLGIETVFEPYKGNAKDTEGYKNFALAEVLHKNKRENTRWFGVIDDDTFFLSLPAVTKALEPYSPEQPYYIGALTEGLFRIAQEGFKAWGGAGFFVSPPLMAQLAQNSEHCRSLDLGFGDLLWRDCILDVTSPTVHLTELKGLHQIDVWGDISGWYETGWSPLLSVHHWKSWHFHPIPMAHTVSDVAGPESFLARYLFTDDVVMTNGYSIVSYPNGLPDLNLTELTFVEEVNVKEKPGKLMFEHSLGKTRPELQQGKDKISWIFTYATPGKDGSVRQFYVKRAVQGLQKGHDSVVEVDWRRS